MSQNVSSSPQVGLNPLVETATKLLSLGAQIQHLPHHGDVEKWREKIAQEIESFDYEIRKFWQDRTSINYPSYVLCTFIDEMVWVQFLFYHVEAREYLKLKI
jgi:type VI protein secretion system component VasF